MMTDAPSAQDTPDSVSPHTIADEGVYADPSLPVIFADFVYNAQPNAQVVRIYLGRYDPSLNGKGEPEPRPFAQLVMPLPSFVNTAIFYENVLNLLIEDGHLTSEEVAEARKVFDGWTPSEG